MSLKAVKTVDEHEEFENRLKRSVVLVVDDFDSMRKVTGNQLRQLGVHKVLEAANGAEALKLLARHPVSIVLSDWNMPVMNGLDLLLSVRSSPELCALPFVMITADAERERIVQAAHVGVSELLVKPYTSGKLAERLERAFKWRPRINGPIDPVATMAALGITVQVAGQSLAANAKPLQLPLPVAAGQLVTSAPEVKKLPSAVSKENEKPTILIVDDTPDNLMLLSQLFKGEYRVKIAHNGKKALSICQSETPPDLILLDIMMPDMDGFEVAQELRNHPTSQQIPVIFVTALTDDASRSKGMELGAVDFVTKPINPDLLRVRVKNFMRYIELQRNLQADYDNILESAHLRDEVEQITRHDIKGPLASVLGLIQGLAAGTNLTDDQREQMRMIEEVTLGTLSMVSRSADIYKIETGQFVCTPKPIAAAQTIRRLVEQARRTYAVKNLAIAIGVTHGVCDEEIIAQGDSTLFYSAFQNLIKNACEAAPDSSNVTISIWDETPLRIAINNDGVVPLNIRDRFFDKFVTQGKQGGTGLGTYSAKLLIEAQGGTLRMVTDDETNSTCLTMTLPRV